MALGPIGTREQKKECGSFLLASRRPARIKEISRPDQEYANQALAARACSMVRVERRDLQEIADLRAGAIYRVGRDFQDAGGLQRNFGDPERPHELFDVNDFLFLAEKNEIDGEQHPDGVNAARRNDPQPAAEARPALGLAEKPDETAHIAIGNGSFGGDEGLPRLVVHIDYPCRFCCPHCRTGAPQLHSVAQM